MAKQSRKEGFYSISWRRYLLPPIHFEGWKILAVMTLIFALIGLLTAWIWLIGVPALIFAYFFFRNPERFPPDDPDAILAPADGIVCSIVKKIPPATLDLGAVRRTRVSIFMSVFNVHVNRCPTGGVVHAMTYHKGKFVNVAHKDSEDNERQEICIERPDGVRIGVVQIAGLVARRIYCPLKIAQTVKQGDVFGLIRFGSRLDVYLPEGCEPDVLLGQTAIAGETVLAKLAGPDHSGQ